MEKGGLVRGKVRQRRRAPKSRTGCITCKIRRIKCDEGKPKCNKCISTGRTCDGCETYIQVSGQDSESFGQTLEEIPDLLPTLSKSNGVHSITSIAISGSHAATAGYAGSPEALANLIFEPPNPLLTKTPTLQPLDAL